ncbi:MAG: glycosyltransferase, partial [Thermoanaerobaculia bacterium]
MRQNDLEDAALIQEKSSPHISIVIPAHNEAASLSETLNEVLQVLSSNSITAEVLVVDDGSTDGTWGLIQEFSSRDQRVRGLC